MKKTFFASDFHLGVDARLTSAERERQLVRWLDMAAPEAEAIYLVGDLFEFWFEYKTVIPKGFSRLFGKLAELRDGGLPVHVFTGNHDLWSPPDDATRTCCYVCKHGVDEGKCTWRGLR